MPPSLKGELNSRRCVDGAIQTDEFLVRKSPENSDSRSLIITNQVISTDGVAINPGDLLVIKSPVRSSSSQTGVLFDLSPSLSKHSWSSSLIVTDPAISTRPLISLQPPTRSRIPMSRFVLALKQREWGLST